MIRANCKYLRYSEYEGRAVERDGSFQAWGVNTFVDNSGHLITHTCAVVVDMEDRRAILVAPDRIKFDEAYETT